MEHFLPEMKEIVRIKKNPSRHDITVACSTRGIPFLLDMKVCTLTDHTCFRYGVMQFLLTVNWKIVGSDPM